MKFLIAFIFPLLIVVNNNYVAAQQNTIDSLENILKKEKNEGKQIDLLNDLFDAQFRSDFEKALQYS